MTKNSLEIENLKLKIVFFGTPDFVLPVAKSLADSLDLVGVLTTPDAPVGRKKTPTPSPVKRWYMEYLLEKNREGVILTPNGLTDETAIKLRKLHADLFVVAAYGKLVPKEILEIPKLGCLNIHPSSLPKYRGPSPIQNALLKGDEKLGITIMKMDEELDHGPIIKQWEIPITRNDTFESLHEKAFSDAARKLPEIINNYISGGLQEIPQDHARATYTKHITKQDGFIDISKINTMSSLESANWRMEIARKIRAYYPWPGAWTKVKVKNNESRIIKFLPAGLVQIEGKKPVKIEDLINGYPELEYVIGKLFLTS